MKRALILSGGGMFGAWQAGAWSVLRERFQPQVVIGVSVGSLNGWAIAGGCDPRELEARWLEASSTLRVRLRLPRRAWDGLLEFSEIEPWIRRLHADYQPKMEYYAILTDLLRMKPRMVEGREVSWRHLAASCALFGLLPQQRIDQRIYTDGGVTGALPLWAADPVHATHVIALSSMPRMPWLIRTALRPFRASKFNRRPAHTVILSPSHQLGGWRDAIFFGTRNVREWIEQGKRDAKAFLATQNISF
ncbi:MAG: patatin-like phospholipase family protein [Bryobacteraceae bacterium]|nr:patatin-like phospholipase family protein [Bryobacteraceae bacterium]MDW8379181.1 patatin-like phospholipase family protein [Bryobacterales bacterium]